MVEVAIIADDLTGAADTGVQFCPYFRDTVLVSHANFSPDALEGLGLTVEALALYTNTRAEKAESARERLGRIGRQLLSLQPNYTYKKVDSCLRGNLGAEVEAIMDQMGYELSFIAPAFPQMGRTTLHDIHLVDGTEVGQTELSRDPVTPVTESRLSRVVAAQTKYGVGHVEIRFMEGGHHEFIREIDRQAGPGVRHLVFDVTCQAHLDRIASAAFRPSKKILLVGSAGLATSLGKHFPKRPFPERSGTTTTPKGNHLIISGTTSRRTELQIAALIKASTYKLISLSPDLLADPIQRDELLSKAALASSALSGGNLIITTEGSDIATDESDKRPGNRSPQKIAEGLGIFVATLLKGRRPATLFLTGGDTASSVLEATGAQGVRLQQEIVPGMPQGTIIGGLVDGLDVVTKAGAFGREDALVSLHEYWMKRNILVF
jgi:uncharacterized protein YgbK (DUF1537 family)